MKRFLLLVFSILFFTGAEKSFAQEERVICGTSFSTLEMVKQRMLDNREWAKTHAFVRGGAPIYVPVRFILVSDDNGDDQAYTEKEVLNLLCRMNNDFEETDIQFYLWEMDYLQSTESLRESAPGGGKNQDISNYLNQGKYDALNIFLAEAIPGNTGSSVIGGFYSCFGCTQGGGGEDYIVLGRSGATEPSTLSHEVGHFLSLAHTFHGYESHSISGFWEDDSDNDGILNYKDNFKVGFTSPNGSVLTELVDGSNCSNNNVSDGFCDTPPDYGFGLITLDGLCVYEGNVQDPDGNVAVPMTDNFMSYFQRCPDYQFTAEQSQAMVLDLNRPVRDYVNPGIIPNTQEITQQVNLLSPANLEVLDHYTPVFFEWSEVPGADNYLLEIIPFNNPGLEVIRLLLETNSYGAFDMLAPNTVYQWTVTPFNASFACASSASPNRFRTGDEISAVDELEGVSRFLLAPNPATAAAGVRIFLHADQARLVDLLVYSIDGKEMMPRQRFALQVGENTLEASSAGLEPGIYFLVLENETGRMQKKLIITQ